MLPGQSYADSPNDLKIDSEVLGFYSLVMAFSKPYMNVITGFKLKQNAWV
jgi:hypothetical protein